MGHLKKEEGSYTQTRGEVLDMHLDAFFPESTEYKEVHASPNRSVSKDEITNLFSPKKLEVAFRFFKKGK